MNKDTKNSHQMTMDSVTACRVCLCGTAKPFAKVDNRDYWSCSTCTAIFLDDSQLPDRHTEYQQYLLHNNDPKDCQIPAKNIVLLQKSGLIAPGRHGRENLG